jgi:hypothetical protein
MSVGIGREGKHWTPREDALISLAYQWAQNWALAMEGRDANQVIYG